MELAQISSYFDNTEFDTFDVTTQAWDLKSFVGQMKIADDFISIFNRPTRRRMLLVSPSVFQDIQNVSILRVTETGDEFMVGNPQHDVELSEYRVTIPLNKISQTATAVRRETAGPTNDPGILIDTGLADVKLDLELRTITVIGETEDSEFAKYFMWFSKDADIEKNDQLTIGTDFYRVIEVFADTGFLGARVTTEPDSRETFTYKHVTASPTYDVNTGVSTPNETLYQISAELSEITQKEDDFGKVNAKVYIVLVEYDHIGIEPNVGDRLTISGTDIPVKKVSRDRHKRAWKLELLQ